MDVVQNVRDDQGHSQLLLAAERGDTEAVRSSLKSSANVDVPGQKHEDVDTKNSKGDTPLHLASKNGHFEVAEILLSNKADANIRNASGKTPLHIGAEMGFADIVKALIDHKGELNVVDRYGNTALHLAAGNGQIRIVKVLLQKTVKNDSQTTLKLEKNQVSAGEFEIAQHPLTNIADTAECNESEATHMPNQIFPTFTVTTVWKRRETPHAEIGMHLLCNDSNVNGCNNAGMTPLHLACQNGHTSVAELLLDNHAIVDITTQCEKTPLYLAVKNGHADVVDLLLQRGVIDFVLKDVQTPLHVAVEEGHENVVQVILKHRCRLYVEAAEDGLEVEEEAKNLIYPRDSFTTIYLLKADGRDASVGLPLGWWVNSDKRTALDLAVWSRQPNMVQLLLNEDLCQYEEEDLTDCFYDLLHTTKRYRVIKRAEVRSQTEQGEMNCKPTITIALSLINSSRFDVHDYDVDFQKPLHSLLKGRIKEIHMYSLMQLLLVKGADFNAKDSSGLTPLMIASEHGYAPTIKILLDWEQSSEMTLDIDARDAFGETALIKAVEGRHVEVVRLLLSHKASVNVHDYCGFTALHATICEPNGNLLDLHFFCEGLRKRNYKIVDCPEFGINLTETIRQLQKFVKHDEETTRIKKEIVELLLENEEISLNAIDCRGMSPLDLAVNSSKGKHSAAVIEALKTRGAVCKLLQSEDEARIEANGVDERGRNPLHRLVISRISYEVNTIIKRAERNQYREQFDLMLRGIYLRPWKFRESATGTDNNGRTPLHYAAMQPAYEHVLDSDLLAMFVGPGAKVNAADMHGKTPLHYAEYVPHYELLVKYEADENAIDNYGSTPKDLKQLREFVTTVTENTVETSIDTKTFFFSDIILPKIHTRHVTQLTKKNLLDSIRISSELFQFNEMLENAVWDLWSWNKFDCLNRRLSQLYPFVHQFIDRLADGISKKDSRFECHPALVGSADEETKIVISADFDFNFQLTKFSRLCDPFPHPLGPKGYFRLRRTSSRPTENAKTRNDETFNNLFNSDQYLLTNEVNCGFKILVEEVLNDVAFWKDEDLFELYEFYECKSKVRYPDCLCKNVLLKMLRPIQDGEGGRLFMNISIDIVACVCVKGWWPEGSLPGINSSVKDDGYTLVFDRPRFYPSSSHVAHFPFSDTFARISFAPLESRIIKESSPLLKAAYMICKMILNSQRTTTYQLKTCLLFCMEAFDVRNGSGTNSENEVTSSELVFWVKRIMLCFREFNRHEVFMCYFMPSFIQPTEFAFDS